MIIAIGYNTSQYVWLLRRGLIKALIERGHDVVVVSPRDDYTERLIALGVRHFHIKMEMNKNPISDSIIFLRFLSILKKSKADLFLGYTIKPNVYGSLAAKVLGIPIVNNIAGLGAVFSSEGLVLSVVKVLYKAALANSSMVFFQNTDDRDLFIHGRILEHERFSVLPGSGVNLQQFPYSPPAPERTDGPVRFLLVSRMIWDKGVGDFVDAARALKAEYGDGVRFILAGGLDIDNPGCIPRSAIDAWVEEGVLSYIGYIDDVFTEIRNADCVVLPSVYPEGTPRTMLEAAAVGRAVITTDMPGCRNTVVDGVSGFQCRPKDPVDLGEKMRAFFELSWEDKVKMGLAGRALMVDKFDESIVIGEYLKVIDDMQ